MHADAAITGISRTPATAARNTIQPLADVVNLTLKSRSGQTANHIEGRDSSGVLKWAMSVAGALSLASLVATGAVTGDSGAFTTSLTLGGNPVVSTAGLSPNSIPKATATAALADSALSDTGTRLTLTSRNVSLNGTALSTEGMLYKNVPVAMAASVTAHSLRAEMDLTGGTEFQSHYGTLFTSELSGTVSGASGGLHTALRIGPLTRSGTQTLFSLTGLHIEAYPGSWAGAYTALVTDGGANIDGAVYIGDTLSVGSLWTVTEPGVMTGFAAWENSQDLTLADTSYKTAHVVLTTGSTTYKPSLGFNFGYATGATLYLNAVGDMRIRFSDGTDVGVGTTGSGGSVSGNTGQLAKFTSPTAVGDSIVSESGTTITVAGALVSTGLITATAGLSMASDTGIQRSVATGLVSVSGGSASNNGGNILFYGGSHATLAGDVNIRSGSTSRLYWDQSATLWTITGPVAMTSTLDTTGLITAAGGISITGSAGGGAGRIVYASGSNGFIIRGNTGLTNDLTLQATDGTIVMNVPAGTSTVTFPRPVSMSSTLDTTGLITAAAGIAITGGSVASGRIVKDASNGIMIQGVTGGTNDLVLRSAANQALIRNPVGTRNLIFDSTLAAFQNGTLTIGSATPTTSEAVLVSGTIVGLTSLGNSGIFSDVTFPTSATSAIRGVQSRVRTAASVYTVSQTVALRAMNATKGAGSTITEQYGLLVDDLSSGTTNYAIYTGTGIVTFGDMVGIKDTSPSYDLDIAGNARIQGENFLYFGGTGSGDFGASIRWDLTLDGDYLSLTSTDGIILNGNTEIDLDLSVYGTITAGNGINVTGPSTFGDITVSGTSNLSGRAGIGGVMSADSWLAVAGTTGLVGVGQYALLISPIFQSTATTSGTAGYFQLRTQATAFTMASGYGLNVRTPNIGAGSAVTAIYGIRVENQTGGGTNYALYTNNGLVRFGDAVTVAAALDVTGSTTLVGVVSSGDLTVSKAASAATAIIQAITTSNTAGTSSRLQATVAGSSAGDAFTRYSVTGLSDWSTGLDNSDSDAYVISASSAIGTSNVFRATSTAVSFPVAVTMTSTLAVTGATTLSNSLTITGPSGSGEVVSMRGNTATGGYLTIYDSVNTAVRGYLGYGSTIISGGAISDVGLRSQAALKFTTGGNTVRYEISSAGAHTLTGAVTMSSTLGVTGVTTATGGVVFASGGSNLNYYVSSSWTITFTDGFAASVNTTGTYARVGNLVSIRISAFNYATGNNNVWSTAAANIPAAIRPAANTIAMTQGFENGGPAFTDAVIEMQADGTLKVRRADGVPWGAGGSLGFSKDVCLSYVV